jgi:uncharacterized RDD family membrane protein YckC
VGFRPRVYGLGARATSPAGGPRRAAPPLIPSSMSDHEPEPHDPRPAAGIHGAAREETTPGADPGLVRRGVATLVDLGFLVLAAWASRATVSWLLAGNGEAPPSEAVLAPLSSRAGWMLTTLVPPWLALSALEALPGLAGPGKRLLGLCVASARPGSRPAFGRILARTLVKFLPAAFAAQALCFPVPWNGHGPLERGRLVMFLGANLWLGIYLAAAAMTRRRQALHDLALGTRVARTN